MGPRAPAPRLTAPAVLIASLALSAPGVAGTICGTVRDADTRAPIPRAGVFVRTPAGAYTGHHAATDATGAYCVVDVPAGVYDLEFRVDHHVTAYVRGVVVEEDVTGVDLDVASGRPRLAARPLPATGPLTLSWERSEGPASIAILDIRGRWIDGWRSAGATSGALVWNLTDGRGARLAPGVYFARLVDRRGTAVLRIPVVR